MAGVILTLAIFQYVRTLERRSLQAAMSLRAQERVELLRRTIFQSMDALRSVAALFRARPNTTRQQFHEFVIDDLKEQPELLALGWTPRVRQSERATTEAAAVAQGLDHFNITEIDGSGKLRSAGIRPEYDPILYLEPEGPNRPAIGFDLNSSPIRDQALEKACFTGQPASTPPVKLIQEKDERRGFIAYQAVYAEGPGDRRSRVIGYASAVFRVQDLIETALADLSGEGLNVSVVDDSIPGAESVIYMPSLRQSGGSALAPSGTAGFDVAGRHWTLMLSPTPSFVAAHESGQSATILCTGLLLTALLSFYLFSAGRRTLEIEHRVVHRTAQLSREVVERKRAEEAARLAELKFRSIVENAIEGIFQTSLDGHYISANTALARIYGYESPNHLMGDLGNISRQLYINPHRREQFIREIQQNGKVNDFESQVYRRDGTVIWISENARAVCDSAGMVLYYEGMVVEVTQRKEAEDALRCGKDELEARIHERTQALERSNRALHSEIAERKRAEIAAASASRAKTDFLANMSHEIRTPMNAILGYAQLLHRDRKLTESHRDALDTIVSSGEHLMSLIDEILDLSKIEAGREDLHEGAFDLTSLVRQVAGMLGPKCRQKRIELVVNGIGAPGNGNENQNIIVYGDERKLRQILLNLAANAVKFTDQGSVDLRVRCGEGDRIWFEVVDTGIGIPPEGLRAIFEPFQQSTAGAMRGGTGLGLAIAKRLVDLMGGNLECSSEAGTGSRFFFSLPMREICREAFMQTQPADKPQRSSWGSGAVRLASGQSVRALVVDDVRENRQVLAEMLGQIGAEVRTAANGDEALAHVAWEPDIVFIDIMMPGIDGSALAGMLRSTGQGAALKLVATSASVLAHEQESYKSAGFDDFVAKPLRCDRLYMSLVTLLGVEFSPPSEAMVEQGDMAGELAIGLPGPLRQRMITAAMMYRVTDLREALFEVDRLGPENETAARFLRRCLHRYDMPAIAHFLAGEQTPVEV
ncbi:MAG: CHASE domain-containing protein [Planctomycetota bacterium]|nr:CHASE domain-containing protein [Planctomycetota bacterium]